jgi:hypothetical protein
VRINSHLQLADKFHFFFCHSRESPQPRREAGGNPFFFSAFPGDPRGHEQLPRSKSGSKEAQVLHYEIAERLGVQYVTVSRAIVKIENEQM